MHDIHELKTETEYTTFVPMIRHLYPQMAQEKISTLFAEMRAQGFRCIGVWDSKSKPLAFCGFWIMTHFYCGRALFMTNMIIDPTVRRGGIGRKIVSWMEATAKAESCNVVMLDVYSNNTAANKFFHVQDYHLLGYHYVKAMQGAEIYGGAGE